MSPTSYIIIYIYNILETIIIIIMLQLEYFKYNIYNLLLYYCNRYLRIIIVLYTYMYIEL